MSFRSRNKEQIFLKYTEHLTRLSGIFTALLIFGMLIAVMFSVILRYIFNRPIAGIDEIVAFVFSVCVFIGLAYTLSIDGHIFVDLLFNKTGQKTQLWLRFLGYIVGLLISCAMIYYGSLQVFDSYMTGIKTQSVMKLPVYLPQIGIPLGFFLLFLELIQKTISVVKKIDRRVEECEGRKEDIGV